jgi:NADPH:quinone reductase-like Zn-dependent oxidoreductase
MEEVARHGVHGVLWQMQPSADDLRSLGQQFDAGTLRFDVARTYPLAQAGTAWADRATPQPLAPKRHGKVVLTVVDLA